MNCIWVFKPASKSLPTFSITIICPASSLISFFQLVGLGHLVDVVESDGSDEEGEEPDTCSDDCTRGQAIQGYAQTNNFSVVYNVMKVFKISRILRLFKERIVTKK